MRVTVVSNHRGKIVALCQLQELGDQPSGISAISVATKGHRSHVLALPQDIKGRALGDLMRELRLDLSGREPVLRAQPKKTKAPRRRR
ncbi:MAG TPA: hypothetical protein VN930_05740 [Xanthobacteraceae bacterium]|nr:hypothetical protein [Xanthobacteraceae bacterium]